MNILRSISKSLNNAFSYFKGEKQLTVTLKKENSKDFSGTLSNGKKTLKFEVKFPEADLYPSDLRSFLLSTYLKIDGLMYLNDTAEEIQTKRAFHNLILDFVTNTGAAEATSIVTADKNHRFVTELGL